MVKVNALEGGLLLGLIECHLQDYPEDQKLFENIFKQLVEYKESAVKAAGMSQQLLPSGMLLMKDKFGNGFLRQPYSWELKRDQLSIAKDRLNRLVELETRLLKDVVNFTPEQQRELFKIRSRTAALIFRTLMQFFFMRQGKR
jgi:hypothetical protein